MYIELENLKIKTERYLTKEEVGNIKSNLTAKELEQFKNYDESVKENAPQKHIESLALNDLTTYKMVTNLIFDLLLQSKTELTKQEIEKLKEVVTSSITAYLKDNDNLKYQKLLEFINYKLSCCQIFGKTKISSIYLNWLDQTIYADCFGKLKGYEKPITHTQKTDLASNDSDFDALSGVEVFINNLNNTTYSDEF